MRMLEARHYRLPIPTGRHLQQQLLRLSPLRCQRLLATRQFFLDRLQPFSAPSLPVGKLGPLLTTADSTYLSETR